LNWQRDRLNRIEKETDRGDSQNKLTARFKGIEMKESDRQSWCTGREKEVKTSNVYGWMNGQVRVMNEQTDSPMPDGQAD